MTRPARWWTSIPLTLAMACAGEAPPDEDPFDAGEPPIEDPVDGTPDVQTMHALAVGPGHTLFIGDGQEGRLFGVILQDDEPDAAPFDDEVDIELGIADLWGIRRQSVAIHDIAVDPSNGRVYAAAQNEILVQDGVFRVERDGRVTPVALDDVPFRAVHWGSNVETVVDVVATDSAVVLSSMDAQWTPSKVVTVPLPMSFENDVLVTASRTYHRAHQAWETEAPIDKLVSWSRDGVDYVGATYSCAPVVRFRVDALLTAGEQIVGETPFDYGFGKQVADFARVATADGEERLVAIMSGLGQDYSQARGVVVPASLLDQTHAIDEDAPMLFTTTDEPQTDDASLFPGVDGSTELAPASEGHVYALFSGVLTRVELP